MVRAADRPREARGATCEARGAACEAQGALRARRKALRARHRHLHVSAAGWRKVGGAPPVGAPCRQGGVEGICVSGGLRLRHLMARGAQGRWTLSWSGWRAGMAQAICGHGAGNLRARHWTACGLLLTGAGGRGGEGLARGRARAQEARTWGGLVWGDVFSVWGRRVWDNACARVCCQNITQALYRSTVLCGHLARARASTGTVGCYSCSSRRPPSLVACALSFVHCGTCG